MNKLAPGPLAFTLSLLGLAACAAPREFATPASSLAAEAPHVAGVDSVIAATALALAQGSFVDSSVEEAGASRAEEGRRLAAMADSLLGGSQPLFLRAPTGPDTMSRVVREGAILTFNEGAQALTQYAAEPDSVRAAALLQRAEGRFEEALAANPFDTEARYWLAQVYELRARRLGQSGANQESVRVLGQLHAMHQDRHDYVALLAAAYDRVETESSGVSAGVLWRRAATIASDDAALDPAGEIAPDANLIFSYLVRSGRAFARGQRSGAALEVLTAAEAWAHAQDDEAFLEEERAWILWDDGNLATRARWDELLALSHDNPEAAIRGLEALLQRVSRPQARREMRHRLALLLYSTGREEEAIMALQGLWREMAQEGSPEASLYGRVREDYGAMAFNIAHRRLEEGDRQAALSYLLQSEKTGFQQSARAAYQAAILLRNNVEAALGVALRAERAMEALELREQQALLRFLVELYRRKGDRERARLYVEKYRSLP